MMYHVIIECNLDEYSCTVKARNKRSAEKKGIELFRKKYPSKEKYPIYSVEASQTVVK
jgi:hypothetical protein